MQDNPGDNNHADNNLNNTHKQSPPLGSDATACLQALRSFYQRNFYLYGEFSKTPRRMTEHFFYCRLINCNNSKFSAVTFIDKGGAEL